MADLLQTLTENATLLNNLASTQSMRNAKALEAAMPICATKKDLLRRNSLLKQAVMRLQTQHEQDTAKIIDLEKLIRIKDKFLEVRGSDDQQLLDKELAFRASQQILELRETIDVLMSEAHPVDQSEGEQSDQV